MQLFRLFYKCILVVTFVLWLPLMTGCSKLLDAGPPKDEVITADVFKNDSLAQAAIIGVYSKMMEAFGLFNGYMSRFPGLSCDELYPTGTALDQDLPFITNAIPAGNTTIWEVWSGAYAHIYRCNELVAGFTGSNSLTPALRDQLLGETYFLRALAYFYLVNLYGNVPLILTTDYTKSATAERTPVKDVYDQLIEDLQNAQSLLTDTYVTTPTYPGARVRVNRQAATALLARIYLYTGQWDQAATAASTVIQSGIYQLETDLLQSFRYKSKEAILQFMPVMDFYNTAEGAMFVPVLPLGKPGIMLCDSLMNHMDSVDLRRSSWVRTVPVSGKKYNSPFKYKLNTGSPRDEYNMVLRLAEQYLIRAESRAMLNQIPEAVNDLNIIRNRAGLPNLITVTQKQALYAVEQERRMELFAEWGHRWFDLKRWNADHSTTATDKKRIDEVMSNLRPDYWASSDALWPIPTTELNRNHNLTQNPGYY